MKTFVYILSIVAICGAASCSTQKGNAYKAEKQAIIRNMVNERNFTIEMSYVLPMRGSQIMLSPDYTLTVRGDSAIAYLPYFGVARMAPYGETDGGIKFKEPMYNFRQITNKRGNGWQIYFDIKQPPYSKHINIDLFDNGLATVQVNEDNRDPISFSGKIEE